MFNGPEKKNGRFTNQVPIHFILSEARALICERFLYLYLTRKVIWLRPLSNTVRYRFTHRPEEIPGR